MKRKVLWIFLAVLLLAVLGGFAYSRRGPKPPRCRRPRSGARTSRRRSAPTARSRRRRRSTSRRRSPARSPTSPSRRGTGSRRGSSCSRSTPSTRAPRRAATSTRCRRCARTSSRPRPTLAQARADLRRAEGNYRRRDHPRRRDRAARATAVRTSEAAVQAAQRRVDQAGATLEGARDTLAKTTIRSPIDGVVTARRVEEGEVAVIGVQNSPGTVLLTISDMSVVEAELEVDETSIPNVKLEPGGAGAARRLPQPDLPRRGHRGGEQPDRRPPPTRRSSSRSRSGSSIRRPTSSPGSRPAPTS